jgi:hypothetical protein
MDAVVEGTIAFLEAKGYHVFDDEYQISEYARSHLDLHDPYDCAWEGIAKENGWVPPELVPDIDFTAYHDDNNHPGAQRWCKIGACNYG